MPKVERTLSRRGFAAPPNGDVGECSWLYAGISGASIRYSSCDQHGSDNPVVCGTTRATPDNQQETATAGSPEAIRQPSRHTTEKMRWSEPCGDAGRLANANPPPDIGGHQVTDNPAIPDASEIPCRVSNDLPSEGAIPHANPAITGNPSLDHSSGESRGKSRVVVRPFDPVTTEAKAKMAFLRKQIYERHKTPALWDLSEVKG